MARSKRAGLNIYEVMGKFPPKPALYYMESIGTGMWGYIHFSIPDGKLDGVGGIGTDTLTNPACIRNAQRYELCRVDCYSRISMERGYNAKSLREALYVNNALYEVELTGTPPLFRKIDKFRLSIHGDVVNATHMRNYYQLVKHNPHVQFSLFTKEAQLVSEFIESNGKPDNLHVVYSQPIVNRTTSAKPSWANIQFVVITQDNPIEADCHNKQCDKCGACFGGKTGNIFEIKRAKGKHKSGTFKKRVSK